MDIFDRPDIDPARRLRGDDELHLALELACHDHLLLVASRQAAGGKLNARCADVVIHAGARRAVANALPVDLHAVGHAAVIIAVENDVLGDREGADHSGFVPVLRNMRDAETVPRTNAGASDVGAAEFDAS